MKNISYGHQSIDGSDIKAVTKALKNDFITRGPQVAEFEEAVASYCGCRFAVAFNSGTSALQAAYFAANLGPKDRVITSPNSFIATTGAAYQRGANVIFIDIETTTGNLDLKQLDPNVNQPSSRGRTFIVPIHFSGMPVDMQKLDQTIRNPQTVVIEDAAHALGSHYPCGQKVGSCAYSLMTIFSFHPLKTITTGEGGMVTTNEVEIYKRLKLMRNNGIEKAEDHPWDYDVIELTGNTHLTEFQAALGLSQLKRLNHFIEKRQEFVNHYRKLLQNKPSLSWLRFPDDVPIGYHLFVVLIDFTTLNKSRHEVMNTLKEQGIETQLHYFPIYRYTIFKDKFGDISPYFPNMEKYFSQTLTLPLHCNLQKKGIERVVAALTDILYH